MRWTRYDRSEGNLKPQAKVEKNFKNPNTAEHLKARISTKLRRCYNDAYTDLTKRNKLTAELGDEN